MCTGSDNHMTMRCILTSWNRRHLGVYGVALALSLLSASTAVAQDYPTRPIRLVVAFAPGGTTDFVARLIAEKVSTIVGQNVIVENKPGGNGAVAAEFVARSEPDGYNLFFSTLGAMAINPNLRSKLNYNPQTDFDPVAMIARNTILLAVNSGSNTKTFAEFLASAKSRKSFTVGVTGVGAATYLCAELLQKSLGIKLQIIPYRGASQALTDLLGGHIDAMFGDIPVLIGSIKGGKIRALASTSKARSDVIPDVPTFVELGFSDILAENWAGVVAPARTPQAIIKKLGAAFEKAAADPNILSQLARSGVTPSFASAEEFRGIIGSETKRWGKIIRENDVQVE
jgi:tripartite-type tricarboxylate transporter receptor subunit TctC